MDIEKRERMAAESILENEAIRDGVDDNGAAALLNWGTACAMRITQATSSIEDDEEAQEAAYPRMRALRQMLDIAKTLCRSETAMSEGISLLQQLMEKARLVYGENMQLPKRIFWNVFTSIKAEDAGQTIRALQTLIEKDIATQE